TVPARRSPRILPNHSFRNCVFKPAMIVYLFELKEVCYKGTKQNVKQSMHSSYVFMKQNQYGNYWNAIEKAASIAL
ncbi:MAG: hypothetical protein MK137_07240, partial [Rickettsiales bacterium]|nr:hypothetical protein [Rickettsiales bacterium]